MKEAQLNIFNKQLDNLIKSRYLIWSVYLMLLSFFYNLPVLNYSLTGNNEFRIYDFVGLYLLYIYINNYQLLNTYIGLKLNLKRLNQFLFWANITLIGTLAFSIFFGRIIWFIQSLLYLYHFWVFFLFAVFLSLMLRDKKKYKSIIFFFLILVIVEAVIVILQNMNVIPFLWSEGYKKTYFGFLSGTMGPNKIVLGMTMLMSFIICVGLYFEKSIKVNRYIILSALFLSLSVIAISGSRTAYLGLLVFIIYFMFTRTVKFVYFAVILSLAGVLAIFSNFEVVDIIVNVFDGRVVNKISDPTILKDGDIDVSQIYDDLGSGRRALSQYYLIYLAKRPYIIPLGIGFNNRLIINFSAHNTYLSLINEVGLVGLVLYFRWLLSYFVINLSKTVYLRLSLNGLILSMLVTLFFGEHLYVYRPLFGLVGFFLFATVILSTPRFYYKK